MNGVAMGVLVFYGIVTLGFILGGALNFSILTVPKVRRQAARMVFLAPIWPVMAVVFAVRGVVPMWRAAEWRKP